MAINRQDWLRSVVPTGTVIAYAGEIPPTGWLLCNGSAISRSANPALFLAIGTSHGIGDGSTTFNLPDYRGTFLRGRVDVTTITASGAVSSNNVTFTNHGINRTGFKIRLQSAGGLTGLALSTDYYTIVVDTNTLAFATTLANAISGTKIAISGAGPLTTVIVQYEDPDYTARTAATVGGNSAGGLGSVQDDQNKPHAHFVHASDNPNNVPTNSTNSLAGGISGLGSFRYSTLAATHSPSSTSAGAESRPKNSLINYIIKY